MLFSVINMKFLIATSMLTLAAVSASFFNPAKPHQEPTKNVEIAANSGQRFAFVDADLDNLDIQADENIQAARKCGFCMGVSFS